MEDTAEAWADRVEDSHSQATTHQGGKGGKKGGKDRGPHGGGGGGGGGQAARREKDISRALSRLLRHQALNAGIKLDSEGYAPLDKVVSFIFL